MSLKIKQLLFIFFLFNLMFSVGCSTLFKGGKSAENKGAEEITEMSEGTIVSESEMDRVPANPPTKGSWKTSYIGLKGYFSRPPTFASGADKDIFKRCEPFTIKSFESKGNQLIMTVFQGNNVINVTGVNRQPFKLSARMRIKELDRYLWKKLDLGGGRNIASNMPKVCDGKLATSMTEKEVLFVAGSPEKVNNLKANNKPVKEWVYVGLDKTPFSYFFSDGRIYAWK